MKALVKKVLRGLGYDIVPYPPEKPSLVASLQDLSDAEKQIVVTAKPFTMTGVERMAALINAVNYICQNNIPGDIVECGVWRGGSMMTVAMTLLANGDQSRSLYLFDTFEGMSAPTNDDKDFEDVSADEMLERDPRMRAYAGLDEVKANVYSTGYPKDKIHFIKGKVEDTIPNTLPGSLSLLRLDTDWYESTKHEMQHLYPLLHKDGLLFVDDYGHWQGSKKAVDEYFAERGKRVFLHRVDYTARILIRLD